MSIPTVHAPLSIKAMLTRKLRWLTLGGQYDWTAKRYPPATTPPPFPPDVAEWLGTLFPQMCAEAAIVNVYSPGDVLSMHRDVAEESDRGLVSVSLGCDALFCVALAPEVEGKREAGVPGRREERCTGDGDGQVRGDEGEEEEGGNGACTILTMRLRSGDALFMSGPSRFAWHGVPRIIPDTCPEHLADWPAAGALEGRESDYEHWRGWMKRKRVNFNVRQMYG